MSILRIIDRRRDVSTQTRRVGGIVIHHSATVNRVTGKPIAPEHPGYYYHANQLSWDKESFHYVIDAQGHIEYVVDEAYAATGCCPDGVHAPTGHTIEICLAGNFNSNLTYIDLFDNIIPIPDTYTAPSTAQIQALMALLRDIRARYNISIENVRGHAELNGGNVRCPGENINLSTLREQLSGMDLETDQARRKLVRYRPEYVWKQLAKQIYSLFNYAIQYLVKSLPFVYLCVAVWRILIVRDSFLWLAPGLIFIPFLLLNWWVPHSTAPTRHLPHEVTKRIWIPYRYVPSHLYIMLVTGEDVRFFQHPGFNLSQIYRAIKAGLASGQFGGESTLTQQMARTIFLWMGRSPIRKGLEYLVSVLMEATLPKRRILELYVNLAQTGERLVGVEAASRAYFNKMVSELSIDEAAMLVAILRNPLLLDAANPSQSLLDYRARLLKSSHRQSGLISRLSVYPHDFPLPQPSTSGENLSQLLEYHHITLQEFEIHSSRYFSALSQLLANKGIIRCHEKVNSHTFAESVAEFQRKVGLPTTGLPDTGTLWELQIAEPTRKWNSARHVAADIWIRPEREGYESNRDGYDGFWLRKDAAERLVKFRQEIHHYGGIITSAGGLRSVFAPVGKGQTPISLHAAGLAFDLATPSGMLDPTVDPYIITRDEGGWRVWARAEQGLQRELVAVVWQGGEVETVRVQIPVVDFTAIAGKYGFYPIPPHDCFPEAYICAEWWHFQCEDVLVPWISQYGIELLALGRYKLPDLERVEHLWQRRKYVFGGRNWADNSTQWAG